jgi:hypothetical protein
MDPRAHRLLTGNAVLAEVLRRRDCRRKRERENRDAFDHEEIRTKAECAVRLVRIQRGGVGDLAAVVAIVHDGRRGVPERESKLAECADIGDRLNAALAESICRARPRDFFQCESHG